VALLPDDTVRRFVGEYAIPHPLLDLSRATSQGPFAMPDYYFELKAQQTAAMDAALDVLDEVACELEAFSGRRYLAAEPYRLDGAERAIVALGSTAGTVKDVVDELRDAGDAVGLLKLGAFRPLPTLALRWLLAPVRHVAVLDRAVSPGGAAPLHAEMAAALYGSRCSLDTYVYGLGGRDLHPADIRAIFAGEAPEYVGLRSEPCPA
jgi:pyruvate ferredoxin oxidoreductase alpha subunit